MLCTLLVDFLRLLFSQHAGDVLPLGLEESGAGKAASAVCEARWERAAHDNFSLFARLHFSKHVGDVLLPSLFMSFHAPPLL